MSSDSSVLTPSSAPTLLLGMGPSFSKGERGHIALDASNRVLEIHLGIEEDDIYVALGDLDPDSGDVKWHTTNLRHTTGAEPSIASEGGRFIEVHTSEDHDALWHRIGYYAGATCSTMTWIGDGCTRVTGKEIAGRYPRVAMNGHRVAVTYGADECVYLLCGQFVGSAEKTQIRWRGPISVGKGSASSIALNNQGDALLIWCDPYGHLVYRVTRFEDSDSSFDESPSIGEITHLLTTDGVKVHGTSPDVGLNEDGNFALVYEGEDRFFPRKADAAYSEERCLFNVNGRLVTDAQTQRPQLSWEGGAPRPRMFATGRAPSVALNGIGAVVRFRGSKYHGQPGHDASLLNIPKARGAAFGVAWVLTDLFPPLGAIAGAITAGAWLASKFSTSDDDVYCSGSLFLDRANWISTNWSILEQRSLREICLPGSHDSAASGVSPKGVRQVPGGFPSLSDDANIWASGLIATIGQTQRLNLYDQLNSGLRYFDLRVRVHSDAPKDSPTSKFGFLMHHGISWSVSLSVVLQDIQRYFQEGHREIAILCFDIDRDLPADGFAELTALVSKYLGEWLLKLDHKPEAGEIVRMPINALLPQPGVGRILAFFDEGQALALDGSNGLYSTNGGGSSTPGASLRIPRGYAGTIEPDEMMDWHLANLKRLDARTDFDLFQVSWTMTPEFMWDGEGGNKFRCDIWYYSKPVLRSLSRDLERTLNVPTRRGTYLNLLTTDFADTSKVVDVAIRLNKKYASLDDDPRDAGSAPDLEPTPPAPLLAPGTVWTSQSRAILVGPALQRDIQDLWVFWSEASGGVWAQNLTGEAQEPSKISHHQVSGGPVSASQYRSQLRVAFNTEKGAMIATRSAKGWSTVETGFYPTAGISVAGEAYGDSARLWATWVESSEGRNTLCVQSTAVDTLDVWHAEAITLSESEEPQGTPAMIAFGCSLVVVYKASTNDASSFKTLVRKQTGSWSPGESYTFAAGAALSSPRLAWSERELMVSFTRDGAPYMLPLAWGKEDPLGRQLVWGAERPFEVSLETAGAVALYTCAGERWAAAKGAIDGALYVAAPPLPVVPERPDDDGV